MDTSSQSVQLLGHTRVDNQSPNTKGAEAWDQGGVLQCPPAGTHADSGLQCPSPGNQVQMLIGHSRVDN